ncbi:MAG: TRAP transporter substrate-binding protein [Candidatus Methylomirabilales bacterium]
MRPRGILACLAVLLGLLLVAGAAGAVEKAADGKIVMRLAHSSPTGNPTDTAAKKWAELINQRTGGKVEIRIFPNEQLGSEKACLEGAVLGTIDISLNDAAYVADLYPAAGVFDFPFTFRDWDHYAAMLKSPIFGEVAALVEKEVGAKPLAIWIYGRRIMNSKKPVRSPADAKGMKIRTPPSELAQENARVLGGIPVTIAFSETYMGLKQGLADAAENPSTAIYDQKWYEVTKYLSLTHHVWNNEILTMSKKAWETLSPEQQKIVRETSSEMGVYRMQLQRQLEVSRLEDLKKQGMEAVTPASMAPFQALAADIKKKYAAKYAKYDWAKWHDRVMAIK